MIDIKENNIPLIPGESRETWIPTSKHLPKTGGSYLCIEEEYDELFGPITNFQICHFNQNSQSFRRNGNSAIVTHWIPIPKIPN